jgi:periplasmic divalent cation tolerance protein
MKEMHGGRLERTTSARLVVTTAPPDLAEKLAGEFVHAGLAACANCVPGVRSLYWWEGAVQNDPETLLLLKTTEEHLDALAAEIERRHPYEVPEILVLDLDRGSAPYLSWLEASLRKGKGG